MKQTLTFYFNIIVAMIVMLMFAVTVDGAFGIMVQVIAFIMIVVNVYAMIDNIVTTHDHI